MSTEGLTLDRFLGGRVTAAQPASGFRAGHDTVLLAAAVPADGDSVVIELGAGAGIASLCLAARVPGVRITGIELDPELVRLANENAVRNAVADRVSFIAADVSAIVFHASTSPTPQPTSPLRGGRSAVATRGASGGGPLVDKSSLQPGSADHVFFNPPFHSDTGQKSPMAARDRAMRDTHDAVREWTVRALSLVRDGGTVTVVVRADRVKDIQDAAISYGGIIFPLFPRVGSQPKRAIVQIVKLKRVPLGSPPALPSPLEGEGVRRSLGEGGRKGGDVQGNARFQTAAGLVLHDADGRNTEAAEAVLRHAFPLNLSP